VVQASRLLGQPGRLHHKTSKMFLDAHEDAASSRLRLAMRDRGQQLIRPANQRVARLAAVASLIDGIGGDQPSLAVLANDAPAKILHPNLQTPPARGTFLHKKRRVGHDGISCRQAAIPQINR
jgi:hypothetical protein